MVRIHQHAKVQAIPPLRSLENFRKLQICPVSQSQNDAKMRINNRWPKSNQFWSGQDTTACQISGHSKWLQWKLRFVVATLTQTLSEKQNEKNVKNRNLQMWPNPEIMLSKPSRDITMKTYKWLQKTSVQESTLTFILHGHKPKSKLQF